MEQIEYLVDTNAVIDYLGKKLPTKGMLFMNDVIDTVPNISVISKIEVLDFDAPKEHLPLLNGFMNDAIVFDLTNNIVERCIDIRKKYKSKLPDAIIAATALECGYTLITRNTADFKNISKLKLCNPWKV
jgi:predicted nucleic acid-binding protein